MALYSLNDILITIKDLLSLLDRQKLKSDKTSEALVCLQTAIIETRKYISAHGYQSNTDLSKLWLQAFDKVKKANIYSRGEFPEYLYQKARFWGNPQVWLKEPAAMELVPTLRELEMKSDSILERIKLQY